MNDRSRVMNDDIIVCADVIPPALISAWTKELELHDAAKRRAQAWKRYHWMPRDEAGETLCHSTLERVKQRLAAATPGFESGCWDAVVGVEFWTQLRSSAAPPGDRLQLHWDVDEALGRASGDFACPLLSIVCYLSSTGGPTIVLNQHGSDGWGERAVRHALVWPVAGSVLAFPGDRLHGVLGAADVDATLLPTAQVLPRTAAAEDGRLTLVFNLWARQLHEAPPPPPPSLIAPELAHAAAVADADAPSPPALVLSLTDDDGGDALPPSTLVERTVWLGMFDRRGAARLWLPPLDFDARGGTRTSAGQVTAWSAVVREGAEGTL